MDLLVNFFSFSFLIIYFFFFDYLFFVFENLIFFFKKKFQDTEAACIYASFVLLSENYLRLKPGKKFFICSFLICFFFSQFFKIFLGGVTFVEHKLDENKKKIELETKKIEEEKKKLEKEKREFEEEKKRLEKEKKDFEERRNQELLGFFFFFFFFFS